LTRDDEILDPSIFLRESPLTLYRIARDIYADLSGIGAAVQPGRWNVSGQEAIYTGLNSSTVQLEKLGHTPKHQIPSNLVLMKIYLSGAWELRDAWVHREGYQPTMWMDDLSTGSSFMICRSLSAAKERGYGVMDALGWRQPQNYPVAVAVPSVHDS
jgi:hypothetical protein